MKLLKKLKYRRVSFYYYFRISKFRVHFTISGLLDQPLLMEGKRKRKATQQFNIEVAVPKKRVAKKHAGSGTRLQDIPSGVHVVIIDHGSL